ADLRPAAADRDRAHDQRPRLRRSQDGAQQKLLDHHLGDEVMSALLFSMALAALICGAMWTRPGVRAAGVGAWRAGWDQACREFRQGYEWAQARLRAGNPTPRDFRWWVSAVLATVYGACKVCGAAGRVGH